MSLTSLSTTFLAALLRDDPPASKFGAEVERAPAGQEADCDSDASSLLSYASNQDAATSNQDAATLPPELVGQILAEAASDRFELFVVEGQFEEIETQCRSCTFRSLAKVCREWQAIARQLFHRDLVLDKKEQVEEFVALLKSNPKMASEVRRVDASLRGRNNEMPELVPADETSVMVQTGERERAARSEAERDLLLQALQYCTCVTHFDADFGFHHKLTRPGMLPTSLRALTLRNIEAKTIFGVLANLPSLTDLTLRLILDFYVDESDPSTLATCQLSRFELSIVGWGETSTSSINRLLANSHHSLQHLILRNKAAVSVGGFLPVARDLIKQWGPQLHSLEVKDIPNNGKRSKAEKPLDWFPAPSRTFALTNLHHLHLTGLTYSPAFFHSLKAPRLTSLTLEDYDTPSGEPLLASLREKGLFEGLQKLRVAESSDGVWQAEREGIEEWCEERGCRLEASWGLTRLERRWW